MSLYDSIAAAAAPFPTVTRRPAVSPWQRSTLAHEISLHVVHHVLRVRVLGKGVSAQVVDMNLFLRNCTVSTIEMPILAPMLRMRLKRLVLPMRSLGIRVLRDGR